MGTQYKGQNRIPAVGQTIPVDEFHWKRGGGPAQQIGIKGPFASTGGQANGLYLAAFGCEPGGTPSLSFGLHLTFDSIDISRVSGSMFRLDASQAGEVLTEIHEVSGSNQSRAKADSLVLRNQFMTFGSMTLAAADNLISKIETNAQQVRSGQMTLAEAKSANHAGATPTVWGLIDDFSIDIKKGDSLLSCMYTYRHTVIIPERTFRNNRAIGYAYANIFNNVECVFSEQQLRVAEGLPVATIFPFFVLPKSISKPALTANWLKQAPHSNLTTGQKRVIIMDYLHADIFSYLYYANAV